MSNNITKFLNSRNEVNLSSEKIELAAGDDDIKKIQQYNSDALGYINAIFQAKEKARTPVRKAFDEANRVLSKINSDKEDFIKKVKDLGINPAELNQPKEYDKALKLGNDYLNNIRGMLKDIK